MYQTPLLTDLYQLTMLQAYVDGAMAGPAVFELFVRRMPAQRNYLVAAGLEQVLDYLETLSFAEDELQVLRETGLFHERFLDYLSEFRFTGEVDAMPEGTVFFPGEPVLQVSAPLPEAQFIESRVMNLVHYQTLVASKAARCVQAARARPLIDFGMRRAHGAEAAVHAARACYVAGFSGTATVVAKPLYDIPVFGTMAHSFIQAHATEQEAFARFADSYPGPLVLLIDTYDVEAGARAVVELAGRLAADAAIRSVRIDSGDLAVESRRVRDILDAGNCQQVEIFASGGLDEYRIDALLNAGAPIDGFGVGTALDVSEDAPTLDCVYKLQEYDGVPRRKRSAGKATYPGRKQVFRTLNDGDCLVRDTVTVHGQPEAGEPLLVPVMRQGQRTGLAEPLAVMQDRVALETSRLPDALRSLDEPAAYPVELSAALQQLTREADQRFP